MAPFLTQERFPKLCLLFQAIFCATREKKRLALKYLGDHKNVIEIGCSLGSLGLLGLLARAFRCARPAISRHHHRPTSHLTGESSILRFTIQRRDLQARTRAIPTTSRRTRAPDGRGLRAARLDFRPKTLQWTPCQAHIRPPAGLHVHISNVAD